MKDIAERLRYLADTVPNEELPGELHAIARKIEDQSYSWRPMKTVPEDAPVLLWHTDGCVPLPCKFRLRWTKTGEIAFDVLGGGNRWIFEGAFSGWMPLPEPPEVKK
jgi:hypothetical protein